MNRFRFTHSLCALVLATSAPPLAALQRQTGPATTVTIVEADDDSYGIDTTIPFATSGGVVDLTLVSGEITVTGWSRAEAHIHVSSEDTPVRFEYGANRILLDTHTARHRHQDDGDIQYNLTVPVGTRVLMHSTSGDLRSQGTHGEIEARSISGDVEIEDAVRSATLESVSGNVKARGIDGDARARSVSGDVDLDRVRGDITLSSISGHGYITGARARAVRLETVSGDLSYSGTFDAAGTYDFRAHSGDIRLELPPDVGAIVSMDTFSGDVRTDFPLTIQPGDREGPGPNRHHIDTTIGKGGAHITVSTFSGDIQLLRSMSHSRSE
jgi:DUF4097 and DUF4098 domain-containing protein YvlB